MPNDMPDWSRQGPASVLVPGSPFTVANDGAVHTLGTFAMPVGFSALGVTMNPAANIPVLQVIGASSGVDYAARSLAGVTQTATVKIYQAIDTSVQVKVTTSLGGGNSTVGLCWLTPWAVVDVDSAEPQGVFLESSAGQVIASDLLSTGQRSVAVSKAFANPARWEMATNGAVIDAAPLAGGFVQIIAAPAAGQSIFVIHLEYQNSTDGLANNSFGNFQDDSGVVVLSRYGDNFAGVIVHVVHGPVRLPSGQGLRVTNGGAVAAKFKQGAVLYTVGVPS